MPLMIIRTFAYGYCRDCRTDRVEKIMSDRRNHCRGLYTVITGWAFRLACRVLVGLVLCGLALITLSYAAINPAKPAQELVSRSVEQIGPLLAMTAGAWLATTLPKTVFDIWLAQPGYRASVFSV